MYFTYIYVYVFYIHIHLCFLHTYTCMYFRFILVTDCERQASQCYIHACIHVCMDTYVHIHAHLDFTTTGCIAHIYVCICVNLCMRVFTCMPAYACTCVCVCGCMHASMHIWSVYWKYLSPARVCVCVCVCVYARNINMIFILKVSVTCSKYQAWFPLCRFLHNAL